MTTPPVRARGNETSEPISAAANTGEGCWAERLQTDELALRAGEHDRRGEEAAERPHEGRDELGVDTGKAGLVGVAGRSLHRLADTGPAEEQLTPVAMRGTATSTMISALVIRTPATVHSPLNGSGYRAPS